jgi:isopenicillin N synthase-like dioxygenase
MNHTIPIVDLEDYSSNDNAVRARFVKDVGDALREYGFFAVRHDLPIDLVKQAYEQCEEFFLLPDEVKRAYLDPNLKGQRGYTAFGTERAKDNDVPDLKEFWHVGREIIEGSGLSYPRNLWPIELAEFKPVMLQLYERLERCALTLLEACGLYLDMPASTFRTMAENGNTILRLIHYPPISEDANPKSIRAAAHEDINFITLLIEATASGLELQRRDGTWMPVVTPPGCIIVDSGDMLQNITNGYFRSTTHRVVNPENSKDRRFSMPFFVHARGEVDLSPLDHCVDKTGGVRTYPDITADEYLQQRLKEIGLA